MVLRQQMIGQYRLFLPETAKKVRHRPFGIRRTRKKTNRRRPHGNGTTASGDGQDGQARRGTRKSTLRRVLEYLPQSTRVPSAKDCTASRTPVFRLAEKRSHPPGRPSARSRFLRRKETGQSPRQGHSGATKKSAGTRKLPRYVLSHAPFRTATRRKDAPRPPIAQ